MIPAGLEVSQSGTCFEHSRGSLYWMAPEILFGAPYGRRADIWALGCTILEIATGEYPWCSTFAPGSESNIKVDLETLKNKMLAEELPEMPSTLTPSAIDFIQ